MAKRQTPRQLGDTLPSGKRQVLTRGNPGNHIRIIMPRQAMQWVNTKNLHLHFSEIFFCQFESFQIFLLSPHYGAKPGVCSGAAMKLSVIDANYSSFQNFFVH